MVNGASKTVPPELVIIPFLVCLFLYWFLVQLGRKEITRSTETLLAGSATEPTEPKPPLRPIDSEEEASLRDCFSLVNLLFARFRISPAGCHLFGDSCARTRRRLIRRFGRMSRKHFGDRFLVIFQNSLSGQPFFAIVPNPSHQSGETPAQNRICNQAVFCISFGADYGVYDYNCRVANCRSH